MPALDQKHLALRHRVCRNVDKLPHGHGPPLLVVVLKIFWVDGMTSESGAHPLGHVMVLSMALSRSIGRIEWRPHSPAMDGSQPARSSELHGEEGCCGVKDEVGAAWCGAPH